MLTECCAEEVTEQGLRIRAKDGSRLIEADTIIVAVGYRSDRELYDRLEPGDREVVLLGDARNVHNIMYAIWDAYEVARAI